MAQEENQDASDNKKKKKKKTQAKRTMEIIRTVCAVGALVINCAVITHVLGFW